MSIAGLIESNIHEEEEVETVIFCPYAGETPDPEWIRKALREKSTDVREIASWEVVRHVLDIPLDSPAGGIITVKIIRPRGRRDLNIRHNGVRWGVG